MAMKRTIAQVEEEDVVVTQKNASKDVSFVKYSQNIDLQDCFNLNMVDGKVYNEYKEKVLYLVINKNSKIKKKLDQILKYLHDEKVENKEVIFIANDGECIQKMITIVEIVKQKIVQLQDTDKNKDTFANNSKAKVEEYGQIVISGEVVSKDKLELSYTQLNFLDYTLIEKEISRNVKKSKKNKKGGESGLYEKSIIEEVLKVDKLIKIPVMYVYVNLHGHKELPVKYVNKYKNLVTEGWSLQQS